MDNDTARRIRELKTEIAYLKDYLAAIAGTDDFETEEELAALIAELKELEK